MAQRSGNMVTSDFPGAASPPGSLVTFLGPGNREVRGRVMAIRAKRANVADAEGNEWAVPYRAITRIEEAPAAECTLHDVEKIARRLIRESRKMGILADDWTFGFDLAPARAGVCRYREKRIDLAVSYCLAATRAEIEDTVLHEIAHAIVGPQHNHDAVWKAKAREIGCVGERCHRVQQTIPRWVGECGCGQQWFRHTLQRKMIGTRMCARCSGTIEWRRNTAQDPAT